MKNNYVKEKKYFVYILECADNTFYTGIALDVEKRLAEHNGKDGKGAKYTRYRQPVKLVYQKEWESKSEALKEEHRIKKLTRKQKEEFLKNNF